MKGGGCMTEDTYGKYRHHFYCLELVDRHTLYGQNNIPYLVLNTKKGNDMIVIQVS